MNFWIPAFLLILVFWGSFWFTYWMMNKRVHPLERRVKRLERYLQGNQTEEQQPQPRPNILPSQTRSRYVTVDHEVDPRWMRQQQIVEVL